MVVIGQIVQAVIGLFLAAAVLTRILLGLHWLYQRLR